MPRSGSTCGVECGAAYVCACEWNWPREFFPIFQAIEAVGASCLHARPELTSSSSPGLCMMIRIAGFQTSPKPRFPWLGSLFQPSPMTGSNCSCSRGGLFLAEGSAWFWAYLCAIRGYSEGRRANWWCGWLRWLVGEGGGGGCCSALLLLCCAPYASSPMPQLLALSPLKP